MLADLILLISDILSLTFSHAVACGVGMRSGGICSWRVDVSIGGISSWRVDVHQEAAVHVSLSTKIVSTYCNAVYIM